MIKLIAILSIAFTFFFFSICAFFKFIISPRSVIESKKLIDFKTLMTPKTPNFYLTCPKDQCQNTINTPPIFNCPVTELINTWEAIAHQHHLNLLIQNNSGSIRRYVVLSKLWRFPDLVDVSFFPLTQHSSTLAIYSHAKFGYSDFGVNKKRAFMLLNHLQKECS